MHIEYELVWIISTIYYPSKQRRIPSSRSQASCLEWMSFASVVHIVKHGDREWPGTLDHEFLNLVAKISLPSSYVDYKVNIYKEGTLLLLNFPFVSFPHLCTQFQWTSPKVETNLNKEIHSRAYVIGWGNFWVESPQALMQIAWTNKRENSQGDKTATVNKKRETLPVLWSNKYP